MALVINNNISRASAANAAYSGTTYKVEIRDTSELKEKIDLSKYGDAERVNPTSLVVVDQFPEPGEQVPLGTPVVLTFMSKDSISVADIADLSEEINVKYGGDPVKKITDDIQSSEEMKVVMGTKKQYIDMTETEKDAVKKYAEEKGIIDSGASDEKVGNIHNDLMFIYSI